MNTVGGVGCRLLRAKCFAGYRRTSPDFYDRFFCQTLHTSGPFQKAPDDMADCGGLQRFAGLSVQQCCDEQRVMMCNKADYGVAFCRMSKCQEFYYVGFFD